MMIKKILLLFVVFSLVNSLSFAEKENTYMNEEYGVTITGPEGWQKEIIEYAPYKVIYEHFSGRKFDIDKAVDGRFQRMLKDNPTIKLDKNQEEKIKRIIKTALESIALVVFHEVGEDDFSSASITLGVSDVSDIDPSTTTLDFVNDEISCFKKLRADTSLIGSPNTIDVNGNDMVRVVTKRYDELYEEYIKDIKYYLIKREKLYILACIIKYSDESNQFIDKYQKVFEKTVNSFVIKDVPIKEELMGKKIKKLDKDIPVLIANARGDARTYSKIWSPNSEEIAFIRHVDVWRPAYFGQEEIICDKYFIYKINIETEELRLIDTLVGNHKFDKVRLLLWDKDGNLVYCAREKSTYKPFFYVIDKDGRKRKVHQDDKLIKNAGVETKKKLSSKLFSSEGWEVLSPDEKKFFRNNYIVYDKFKVRSTKNGKRKVSSVSWNECSKKEIFQNVNWGIPSVEDYKKPKESTIRKSETDIINGKIIDKKTKKPIENVFIISHSLDYKCKTATDAKGIFGVRYCKGSPWGPRAVELEFFSPDYYCKELRLFEPTKRNLIIELSPKQKDVNLPILKAKVKSNQGFNFSKGESTLNSEKADFIVSLTSNGELNEFKMLGNGGIILVKRGAEDIFSAFLNMTEAPKEGYLTNIRKDSIYHKKKGGSFFNFYIRTRDGKHYAKLTITSFAISDEGFFLFFCYVYQPDRSRNLGSSSPFILSRIKTSKKKYENLPYNILLKTD
ncbi:MAG: hypothetical protein KAU83_00540 [Bacteroidales bacterium]|nr:hypothetical protein [Bacteroidales bacterium]